VNSALGVPLFPYPFRHPATAVPLAFGSVTTMLAGTQTLVATFADAALTQPNPNPCPLDSSGYARLFFSPLNGGTAGVSYDVVVKDAAGLVQWTFEDVVVPVPTAGGNATDIVIGHGAAPTLTIAGGSITPWKNLHLITPEGGAADNLDAISIAQFPEGGRLTISNTNGAATITIRNNQGNIFTSDGQDVLLNSTSQRLSLIRYGANFYVDMQVGGGTGGGGGTTIIQGGGNFAATGRLTGLSGAAVPTIDYGTANIYYTPYHGNVIDLYDGVSAFQRFTFSELTLPLSGIAAGVEVIDVFAFNSAGVVALVAVPWSSAIARGSALVRQQGVLVNSAQPTQRYLGTVAMNGTGTTADGVTARYIWNYYNRVRRAMRRLETTASWDWSVSAYHQANASALNQLNFVIGVSEDALDVDVVGRVLVQDPEAPAGVSIGLDSATTPAVGVIDQSNGLFTPYITQNIRASLMMAVPEGKHAFVWLERGHESGATWTGVGTLFRAGMSGSVLA
jgi:hypothetical protein